MITLLCGDNDFELTKKVAQLKAGFDGTPERFDASELSKEQLADIFAGQTLFALNRFVIIDSPTTNSDLWQNMPAWVERLNDDTQLLLIEAKPDKRTSTYKWLKKNADVQEFAQYDERDTSKIIKWLESYAKQQDVALTSEQMRRLVNRGGADQWAIAQAIDKLALVNGITDEWIDTVLEPHPNESVFALFETALNGDADRLRELMTTLRQTEDAYRVLGLVSSQSLQLAVLIHGQGNVNKAASDTGAKSSYPFQKLAPIANRMNKNQAAGLVGLFADADTRLKSSDADPWLVLESTLLQVASL